MYLEAIAAELDAAENTQSNYARDLMRFAEWLTDRKLHFATATRDHVEGYLIDCENLDQAIKYAAMIPTADHGTIEVRPIMNIEF